MSVEEEAQEGIETPPPESNVNQDEVVAHPEETVASTEAEGSQEVAPTQADSDKEYNFKRARQEIENLQYESRKWKERYEEATQPKGKSAEEDLKDLGDEIGQYPKDDLLTVEQAEKINLYREKKSDLRIQELEQRLEATAKDSVEQKIMSRYPDYFSVASNDNLEELKSDPLFVKSLQGLSDPYDQASFIYEQIKLRGMGSQESREKRQLESNASKPRSSNSLGGTSPLHMANDYSGWPNSELKSKLFQEMQTAIKGAA